MFFDIRYQQNFTAAQLIEEQFQFDVIVFNDVNGYALVLTNKLVSVSSNGQKPFDLTSVIFNFFITLSFSFIDNFVVVNKASL